MRTIGFYTSKNDFSSGYDVFRFKELLFHYYTCEEIEEVLAEKGIVLQREQILTDYLNCYDFDGLLEKYHKKFKKQVKKLNDELVLLDEDCLLLYMMKVVKEAMDISTLPDPAFINSQIDIYMALEGKEKVETMIQILKAINAMHNYHKEKTLSELFRPFDLDIQWFLEEEIGVEIHNEFPNVRQAREIYKEIMQMVDSFELDFPWQFCSDGLALLAEHSYEKAKKPLAECIKKYPEHKIRFCVTVLTSLINNPLNSEISKKLIEEIQATPPVSDDDYCFLDIFKVWIEDTEFDDKNKLIN